MNNEELLKYLLFYSLLHLTPAWLFSLSHNCMLLALLPSYYPKSLFYPVSTIIRRAITDEMIKNYIENHSKKEDKFGK
ncbi:hypothetical protein JSQ73_003235 [Wolbachia endosymbiont of Anopheles demeilloni]|nr:hypothetical protein [Wolbachia endosymbiont of Anopheles demeilloni]UIP93379.1 hypothetical protein JSQ73_003235 [Wolbachia endosymbiont of Anopheles demeilloni]